MMARVNHILVLQLTSGSGGWPMSVFLTPDLNPVAGGTYFPPEDKYGRAGFKTVLLKIAKKVCIFRSRKK